MGRPRNPNTGMVICKEAFLWVKDARPATYEQITVVNRRTGEPVTMNSDRVIDQGSDGIPYVFKAYQRVPRSHPVVKAKPWKFAEPDELDAAELDLVTS